MTRRRLIVNLFREDRRVPEFGAIAPMVGLVTLHNYSHGFESQSIDNSFVIVCRRMAIGTFSAREIRSETACYFERSREIFLTKPPYFWEAPRRRSERPVMGFEIAHTCKMTLTPH